MAVSANRLELLQIADAVAREKSIDREIVIAAMEDAIQKAARSRYGQETDIRAEINPKTGEIKLQRLLEVVETVEDYGHADRAVDGAATATRTPRSATSSPSRCRRWISAASPPSRPSRSSSRRCARPSATASIDEYKDRIGEIVNGTVKRVEYGNVIVDLGRGEGIIRRDELIPRETFRYGDRVRAYVYDVRREQRGPQIFLSRTHPQFMAKLFARKCRKSMTASSRSSRSPAIRAAAPRSPSSRAIRSIDPVGACVGMRGSRVQAVVGELQGEKIDIIPWSPIGRDLHRQRAAAGRSRQGRARRGCRAHRGRGAGRPAVARHRPSRPERAPRLAADRLGHRHPDRAGRDASAARRNSTSAPTLFMEALDVDEMVGQLLASEGFATVEEIAYVDRDELASIEGFDEETAERNPDARPRISREASRPSRTRSARSSASRTNCARSPGMTTAMLVALGEDGIKTIEDFAGCAADDLVGWKERKDGETKRVPGRAGRASACRAPMPSR